MSNDLSFQYVHSMVSLLNVPAEKLLTLTPYTILELIEVARISVLLFLCCYDQMCCCYKASK